MGLAQAEALGRECTDQHAGEPAEQHVGKWIALPDSDAHRPVVANADYHGEQCADQTAGQPVAPVTFEVATVDSGLGGWCVCRSGEPGDVTIRDPNSSDGDVEPDTDEEYEQCEQQCDCHDDPLHIGSLT